MRFYKLSVFLLGLSLLTSCVGNMNPTGGNSTPNYPYFITTKPLVVKKILVPAGTRLVYEEQYFKEGEQKEMLSEEKLITISLQDSSTIYWGGVPITEINKFFNSEMRGYTVYADFKRLDIKNVTKFSELWKSCSDGLGISIKNGDDWSFNPKNIDDVQSCSVLYQRYFKDDMQQQQFLDNLYSELKKAGLK